MKKIITSLFCAGLLGGYAQDIKPCGTTEAMAQEFALHPELYKEFLEREAELAKQDAIDFQNSYKEGSANGKMAMPPVYTIPIVFHILHQYGPENVSDAQIYDAVRILNEDFRKLNADISQVATSFQSITADAEIEFKLATIDPNGNCTNGIVRHVDVNTDWPNSSSAYAYTWPRNKYLNVYVVKSISSGAAGYTYLPGTTSASSDAIVILNGYVGSIGTANANTSRALTHEIGHWLNLQHVWGSSNNPGVACGNDGVTDTPVTMGYYSTCPLTNCDICNAGTDENVQNYMEYSYCSVMFTNGQRTRMRNALISSTASRNNLWTAANLTATGVSPQGAACAPIADFAPNTSYSCTGANVIYNDLSWNGQPTSWSWSFPGGNPSTSTDSFPVVSYASPGVYSASFTVTNAAGTNSVTKTNCVTVYSSTATYPSGWQEGFETSAIPNSDWSVNNLTGGVTWVRTSNAAANGTYSMYLQNTANTALATDEAISPTFNLQGLSSPVFTFKVAHAQKNANQSDRLRIYYSTNCGVTWAQKYNKAGSVLQTLGSGVYQTAAFTPTASQWRTETVSVTNISNYPNIMFKFVFYCDSQTVGNNIYIDDINLTYGGVGMEENILDNTIAFFVAPNPSNGQAFVNFNLIDKMPVRIDITDITGRLVETLVNSNYEAGEYRLNVGNNGSYAKGIYFVNLKVGERMYSQKMLIE